MVMQTLIAMMMACLILVSIFTEVRAQDETEDGVSRNYRELLIDQAGLCVEAAEKYDLGLGNTSFNEEAAIVNRLEYCDRDASSSLFYCGAYVIPSKDTNPTAVNQSCNDERLSNLSEYLFMRGLPNQTSEVTDEEYVPAKVTALASLDLCLHAGEIIDEKPKNLTYADRATLLDTLSYCDDITLGYPTTCEFANYILTDYCSQELKDKVNMYANLRNIQQFLSLFSAQ